jgi:hypothetical protein
VTGGDEVVTEVVTPLNPLSATISEQVSLPVTTFSSNFSQNTNDVVEAADETNNSKSGESLENRGSDTCSQTSESFSEQGLEGVTTSASLPTSIIEPSAQITNNPIAPLEPTAQSVPPIAPSDLKPKSEQAISDADAETIRKLSAQEPPSTLSTGSSQSKLLMLQDYARRIMEALEYQSPAIARAISRDIQRSIVAGEVSSASLAGFVGVEIYQAFTVLRLPNEEESELVKSVRVAIASNDAETAKSVLSSLKKVCNSGAADRQKVWNHGLTESERAAFTALVQ